MTISTTPQAPCRSTAQEECDFVKLTHEDVDAAGVDMADVDVADAKDVAHVLIDSRDAHKPMGVCEDNPPLFHQFSGSMDQEIKLIT